MFGKDLQPEFDSMKLVSKDEKVNLYVFQEFGIFGILIIDNLIDHQ